MVCTAVFRLHAAKGSLISLYFLCSLSSFKSQIWKCDIVFRHIRQVWQFLGSRQGVVSQSSGSCQEVIILHLSYTHQGIIWMITTGKMVRQSSSDCQADAKLSWIWKISNSFHSLAGASVLLQDIHHYKFLI